EIRKKWGAHLEPDLARLPMEWQMRIRALGENWYDQTDILQQLIEAMTNGHTLKAMHLWRMYCLTPHPDSLLMWAHYGEKHEGICLEFDATREFGLAYRVAYSDNLIAITPDLLRENVALAEAMVLTKSSEWKYEDEYRMLARDGAIEPDFPVTTEKNYYS